MAAELRTDLGIIANRRLGCERQALEDAMYGSDGYPGAYLGEAQQKAADRCGVSRTAIAAVLEAPHIYDPFLDKVAIRRAVAGEWKVIRGLTVWEREEFKKGVLAFAADKRDPEGWRVFGGAWPKLITWIQRTT